MLRREVLGDEILADFLAHSTFDQSDAALPPRPLLRSAGQGAPVELPVPQVHLRRQVCRAAQDHPPVGPELPLVQATDLRAIALSGGHGRDVLQVAGLAHHDRAPARALRIHARGRQPLAEGEARRQILHLRRVICLLRIAAGHVVPVPARQLGLESADRIRRGSSARIRILPGQLQLADQPQHVLYELAVGLAGRRVLLLPVVRLVRQTEPGLHQVGTLNVLAGILLDPIPRNTTGALHIEPAEYLGQVADRGGVTNKPQGLPQAGQTRGGDALHVHKRGVQGAHAAVRLVGGGGLYNLADLLLGEVTQLVKGAVDGAIAGDRVGRQPGAVDVPVQVLCRRGLGGLASLILRRGLGDVVRDIYSLCFCSVVFYHAHHLRHRRRQGVRHSG